MPESLWNRLICCVTGHDYSVRSDTARMYLRCDSCGRTSDGWALSSDTRVHPRQSEHVRQTGRRPRVVARHAPAR
jgi:hypothetical protein